MNDKASKLGLWLRRGAAGLLSLMLVFSLIQPGLARADAAYICGKEEHTHSDACYEIKTQQKTVQVLKCSLAEAVSAASEEDAAPGYVHTHGESCYVGEELVCPLKEVEAHTHGAECYGKEPQCGQEEVAAHGHSDACRKELTCTQEHDHTEECYTAKECTLEETEGHTHTAECYNLTCEKPEIVLHEHDDNCYAPMAADGEDKEPKLTCTTPEVIAHVHDENCYEEKTEDVEVKSLICGLEEHTHTDACVQKPEEKPEEKKPAWTCGKEAHTHAEGCYDAENTLICTLDEHTHTDACAAKVEEQKPVARETYEKTLQDLLTRAEALSKEAADYETQWEAILKETENLRETLASDCEAGIITVEERDELLEKVDELENIYYAGFVPEEEQSSYLQASDIDSSFSGSGSKSRVFIAVRLNGTIPGEPALLGSSYYDFFNSSYALKDSETSFASNPTNVISKKIVNYPNFRYKSVDGSDTAGLVDGTGQTTGAVLDSIDFEKLFQAITQSSKEIKATDGNRVDKNRSKDVNINNYKLICYTIKLQHDGVLGWHIDCVVVPKDHVILSYNLNLPEGYTVSGVRVPNAETNQSGSFTVKSLTGATTSNGKTVINAKNSNGVNEQFTFLGWSTTPDTSGTLYQPNSSIQISKNTTLYARWSSNANVGNVAIKKAVVVPAGVTAPNNLSFKFKIDFSDNQNHTYKLCNENGVAISSHTVEDNGTITLQGTSVNSMQQAVLEGLTKDTVVTITETESSEYTTSWGSGNGQSTSVTVAGGITTAVTCTNTYNPNTTITIKKNVVGSNKEFSFDVYVNDNKHSTVKMQGGEQKTVTVHKNDDVYVVETDSTGYAVSSVVSGGNATSGVQSATFEANGQTVTFTNTQYCSLSITKAVSGDVPQGATFPINVKLGGENYANQKYSVAGEERTTDAAGNISLAANETAVISGIPYGTAYTVSEDPGSDYSVTYTAQRGTVGNDTSVTVTNTRKTGTLTIKKSLGGTAIPDADKTFSFDVFWTDAAADAEGVTDYGEKKEAVTATAAENGAATVTGIPYGAKVKVVETTTDGYTVTSTTGNTEGNSSLAFEFTPDADGNQEVTFTNTQKGKLSITKRVEDTNNTLADFNLGYTINVTLKDSDGNAIAFASGAKYKIDTIEYPLDANGTITLQAGQTAVIEQLPIDVQYTVTESDASGTGFDVAYNDSDTAVNASGGLTDNTTVTITNKVDTAEVPVYISKTLRNHDKSAEGHTYYFALYQKLNDAVIPVSGVQPVAVTVKGNSDSAKANFTLNYDTSDLVVNGVMQGSRTLDYVIYEMTAAENGQKVTNTETGALADAFAITKEQEIKVILTGTKDGIAAKAYFGDTEVTEEKPANFDNILLEDLTIVKEMADEAYKDVTDTFLVDVVIESEHFQNGMTVKVNGTEKAAIANGAKSVTLTGISIGKNQNAVISGIPHGSTYTITETNGYGYQSEVVKGTVDGNEAIVTNKEMTDDTVKITFTKKLNNPDKKKHTFNFALTEVDKNGKAVTDGKRLTKAVDIKGESAEFSFDALTYKTSDLAGGTVDGNAKVKTFYYLVSETTQDDWKTLDADETEFIVEVTLTGKQGALKAEITDILENDVSKGADYPIEFQNTLLGSLTVKKSVVGGGNPSDSFKFRLKLDKAHDGTYLAEQNDVDTTLTIKNGLAEFWLRRNEEITIYGLPHGLEVEVYEFDAEEYRAYHKIDTSLTRKGQTANAQVSTDGTTVKYINYDIDSEWLPQTGQLKWPVLVLAALGIGLLGFGALSRKRKRNGK